MGFDVVYLPPIHPIGASHRKGRNNSLQRDRATTRARRGRSARRTAGTRACTPSSARSRTSRAFAREAERLGLEVALDLAFQCSPDHPYVGEHPLWFARRPDGSVQYAENPPKKYEDIFPLDFGTRRMARAVAGAARRRRVLDRQRRPGVSRRQSAYEAVRLLALAHRRRAEPPSRYAVPRRSIQPAARDVPARQARLQPVVYLFHVAQHEAGARRTTSRSSPRRATTFGPISGRTRRTSCTSTCRPAAGRRSWPAPRSRPRSARATASTVPRSSCSSTRRAKPAARSTSTRRSTRRERWDLAARGLAARVSHAVERDPPRQSGPATRRHPDVPAHRQRPAHLLLEARAPTARTSILVVVNLDPQHAQSGFIDMPLDEWSLDAESPYQAHELLTGQRYEWQGPRVFVTLSPAECPACVFRIEARRSVVGARLRLLRLISRPGRLIFMTTDAADDPLWYKDAVIYQLHVRSFFDQNDDGVGDFPGLTSKLDYIERLGVSAIWLLPFYPSPMRDDGYDIADYLGINPAYGTQRDFAGVRARRARARAQGHHRARRQSHVRPASVVPGGAHGAARLGRSATSTSGAIRTSAFRRRASSSRTPSSRTGRGIRSPTSTTGTASSRISRT